MHDQIFANQAAMNVPDLRRYAEGLKLDISGGNLLRALRPWSGP